MIRIGLTVLCLTLPAYSQIQVDAQSLKPLTGSVRAHTVYQPSQFFLDGQSWSGTIDPVLGTAARMWTSRPAPGTQDSTTAKQYSERFLADHISKLVVGSTAADFRLVSNKISGNVRVVGFKQYRNEMEVIGGQVSFRYQSGKLAMVAIEGYPRVDDFYPTSFQQNKTMAQTQLQNLVGPIKSTHFLPTQKILPLVSESGVTYHRVTEVNIRNEGGFPWKGYLGDFGVVVAITPMFQTAATVEIEVPERFPGNGLASYPASYMTLQNDAGSQTCDIDGSIELTGPSEEFTAVLSSSLVSVVTVSGNGFAGEIELFDGQTRTLQTTGDERLDSQLAVYAHTNVAKEYARLMSPDLDFLDEQLLAKTNIEDECNAFYDGGINFFQSSDRCANTGLLADVVYHEIGHGLHHHSVIEGVGRFDSSFSEGVSDFFAALITEDSGMGRGFRNDSDPLRELDPASEDITWPDDIGPVHSTGLVYARSMWDLWQLLKADLGEQAAEEKVQQFVKAGLERSSDIPSAFLETLLEDDDDGDLSNGTPNVCAISSAFGQRGLRYSTVDHQPLTQVLPNAQGFPIEATIAGIGTSCPHETILDVELQWRRRGSSAINFTTMSQTAGTFTGLVPDQRPGRVIEYRMRVLYSDGTRLVYPQNPANPWFEFYVGELMPLYCTDFTDDPFAAGWLASDSGEWEWGQQQGTLLDDPSAPYEGNAFVGNDLKQQADADGKYDPNGNFVLTMPEVDVGTFSNVRLQYWRWLNVEDGHFDQASIKANDFIAWTNASSNMGNNSAVHHRDQQWTFHDVSLSPYLRNGKVQVSYELTTDQGLELGGWNIDSLCVLADPEAICGDGEISVGEQCDDGEENANESDSCREFCRRPVCGDGIIDTGEGCDDGNSVDGDGCSPACVSDFQTDKDYGCRASTSPWAMMWVLWFLVRTKRTLNYSKISKITLRK